MRALRVAGWSMVAAGALILLFLGYQLGVTTLFTAREQDRLAAELETRIAAAPPSTLAAEPPPPEEPPEEEPEDAPSPVLVAETAPGEGEALGRMLIPKVDLEAVVVEGVGREDLKTGPGHMPWTPLPGQPGNAVISGHRTTYGAPFYDVDQLEEGDEIVVETAVGRHVYEVRESIIVAPTDVWVTDPRPGAWLTLTTCHPRFSAQERLIVFAELVEGPNLSYVTALGEEPATSAAAPASAGS